MSKIVRPTGIVKFYKIDKIFEYCYSNKLIFDKFKKFFNIFDNSDKYLYYLFNFL